MTKQVALSVKTIEMTVDVASVDMTDGVGFAEANGNLYIVITCGGVASYVTLRGEEIDIVGGLMADCVLGATRAQHPSLGGVQ